MGNCAINKLQNYVYRDYQGAVDRFIRTLKYMIKKSTTSRSEIQILKQ